MHGRDRSQSALVSRTERIYAQVSLPVRRVA
jgi:hypothetical protein